jgi:hypothetical protein
MSPNAPIQYFYDGHWHTEPRATGNQNAEPEQPHKRAGKQKKYAAHSDYANFDEDGYGNQNRAGRTPKLAVAFDIDPTTGFATNLRWVPFDAKAAYTANAHYLRTAAPVDHTEIVMPAGTTLHADGSWTVGEREQGKQQAPTPNEQAA